METEVKRWYKKLWETKGSRFIAANRLELHDKWSTITVSIFTVYIISLNLLILFPEEKRLVFFCDTNITYSTICLSILILAVSLIISSRNYKLRADKFHECGRRINKLYDRVCMWKNTESIPDDNEIKEISKAYSKILDRYENHAPIDYLLFKANNMGGYDNIKHPCWFYFRVKTQFFLQTRGFYILIILIPLLLAIKMISGF